ncbi:tail fiber domain-containing protein [Sphingobium vermicomposti]|uniref:Peptidase S74 domain-containing protein n=1 Tax=Sphingobium vermicomposti TaxID=529005 RepID=A0A846M3L1_9SPHN|nr:tail fiber domain-containing protein [Sphingobium vermicomposti]NIJ16499.1 hypothetical protein [Sphingobium vermicomposti]
MGVFNQNQPGLAKLTDTVQGTVPGLSSNFSGWSPTVGQSQDYYGDVLDGKFLDPSSNPGLKSVLDRNMRDVTDQVNSQFSMAGRYGSNAHVGTQTRELADSNGAIMADAYNRERGYQGQAAGAVNDASNQSLAALLQAAGVGAELPYTGTNNLSSALSALFSGGTQKSTQSGGIGGVLQGIGSIGSSAAALAPVMSDHRLKSNIEKVGAFPDGLGVYDYDYIDAPSADVAALMPEGRQRGVMASEVAKLRPWALGPDIGGFQTVNYGAL